MQAPEIRCIRTESFEMDYISFGHGARPFVIIPGVSMKPVTPSAAAVAQGFSIFAEDWTVYLFDRKKNITAGYSVMDMARDTAAAMTVLGLTDADIFGASQGGMIAQCIALEHPELVHALYLGSTMSRPGPVCRETLSGWLELVKAGDITALNHGINVKIFSPAYYARYQEIFAAMETDGTAEEAERFRVLVQACLDFDVYDRLQELRCPVFTVGATEDHVLSGDASVEIAEKLGCPLYLYEGCSHAVYDEAPDYRSRMKEALLSLD